MVPEDVIAHFAARSTTYDRSSSWCTDQVLGERILALAEAKQSDRVLDVACGTGLVSRLFSALGAHVTGVDVTPDMADQARPYLDELRIAPAEALPFDEQTFDIVVCRQGIQFMVLPDAVEEMFRVVRPGGRIVLSHLCAYGPDDLEEYTRILELRNPARRQVFLPADMEDLLRLAGCQSVTSDRYTTNEDVDLWADNGAIAEPARQAIRDVYASSSPAFRRLHAVRSESGRLYDQMLFVTTAGRR